MLGLFGGLGGGEIVALLVLALLFFGSKRLPELAKGLGSSIQEFKKGLAGQDDTKRS